MALKTVANLLHRLGGNCPTHAKAYHHTAVILAAGVGSRMGADTTKQMRLLGGLPLIVHTLKAFEASSYIHEIVVVCREEEVNAYADFQCEHGLTKLTGVVVGGETRADSSRIGVAAVSKQTQYVSIHDGARCLITPAMIEKVVRTAYEKKCVSAAACRAKDTMKVTNADGYVTETTNRAVTWQVQTPQTMSIAQYRAASAMAQKDGIAVTDDCMMAEHVGFPVRLCDCTEENLKVTTPLDLKLAELILQERAK